MLSLNDREWNHFFIGGNEGVFTLRATSSGIDKNKLESVDGNVPYVTRSDQTNGIQMFVGEKQNAKYRRDPGNVITIGLDTQTIFYQPDSFYTGQNIQILEQSNLDRWNAMFIIPLIKQQMVKFNWGGNGATLGRLKRTKLALPVDASGAPDWDFMSAYMREQEKLMLERVLPHFKQRLLDNLLALGATPETSWGG